MAALPASSVRGDVCGAEMVVLQQADLASARAQVSTVQRQLDQTRLATAALIAGAAFHEIAGAGHLPAQEMLGVVLLGGPSLYGQKIATDPCEARYWLRQAAANGGSASLPRALAGRPHGQGGVVCP